MKDGTYPTARAPIDGVSVVVPTYNGASWVRGAIESVLSQSCDYPLEVIAVDDGSTDDTKQVVESISDARVRVISTPSNLGVAGARNYGIQHCRYSWLAFNDQDDVWMPGKLDTQLKVLLADPSLHAVAGGAGRLGRDGKSQWSASIFGLRWKPEHTLQLRNPPYYDPRVDGTTYLQTLLVERAAVERVGSFRQDLPLSDDLDLFMRLAEQIRMGFVPKPMFLYRLGDHNQTAPSQLSAKRFLASHAYYQAARECRESGQPEPEVSRFLDSYAPSNEEIQNFLIAQGIRHVNTVWVNRGGASAVIAAIALILRHPVAASSQILSRLRWWLKA